MAEAEPLGVEFSRSVVVTEIGQADAVLNLSASESERQALARRFSVQSIVSFEGQVRAHATFGGEIEVSGRFTARLEQTCVVSLETFEATVSNSFFVRFAREAEDEDTDRVWGLRDEEPPEPILGEAIDLGEVLAQQLGLSIDPFPRRPGVALQIVEPAPEGTGVSPFSALARLKNRRPD